MNKRTRYLILTLLAVGCLTLAASIQPRATQWSQHGQDSVLKVLLGDGRRIFANHFFTKADIYFHSGYYPSIFDRRDQPKESHIKGHDGDEGEEHEKEAEVFGKPRDWVEAFGRHFLITTHTHLEHGQEREILPWIKLSAELDPQMIDSYTVGAYWLANQLGKIKEAEDFLREGLRANPESYELLFSLGRIYNDNEHDPVRARNVWQVALRRWDEQQARNKKPDTLVLEEITVHLARLEEKEGNYQSAIACLERAKDLSPAPQVLQRQIDDLKGKSRLAK